MAECGCSFCTVECGTDNLVVEKAKDSLTSRKDLKRSVDWLTEATKRLSDAYLAKQDYSTVSMKNVVRREKVCSQSRH